MNLTPKLVPVLLAALLVSSLLATRADADQPADAIAPWTRGFRCAPLTSTPGRHTIHSYYVANPESPDGKYVLFYASADPSGHVGDVVIVDRTTGEETVLAAGVHTEDAHRAACQQWLAGGRMVAYHEVVDKRWRVVVVDVASRQKTIVAEDRQVGFGQPAADLLPMYGCHWNPGPYRDLYVWDAKTGQTRTALSIAAVESQHAAWLKQEFGDKPTSIFFPVLSPDLQRVFFKMAAGNGGDNYMAKNASQRQGIVCFDLGTERMTWFRAKWGHPGWHPDSRRLSEAGNLLFDIADPTAATYARLSEVPSLRGSHPSVSPDGRLWVTDGLSEPAGGKANEWGILVADMQSQKWVLLHSFDQSRGARSWRRSHPHPAFSADGKRIYYNVSDGEFTRLFVAEIK